MANDEKLQQLLEQVERKKQRTAQLRNLEAQRAALARRLTELEAVKQQEQDDVDRLEGRSLAALFYSVVGRKDEKLDKERAEACAARIKYNSAQAEMNNLMDDLCRIKDELQDLEGCEAACQAYLAAKAERLQSGGGETAARLLGLQERMAVLRHQAKELDESIRAGEAALSTAKWVRDQLDSAEGWSTWDVLGGGLISDLSKYSHLDEAQQGIQRLQSQLTRFQTELADVDMQANLQLSEDSFLRFADLFFDNIFTDLAVRQQISGAQGQLANTVSQLRFLLDRLRVQSGQVQEDLDKAARDWELAVRDAET